MAVDRDIQEMGGATAPAESGNGEPVEMTNPQGQRVRVPANRVEEAKKKGYK